MRCIGQTRSGRRCKNIQATTVCHHHKRTRSPNRQSSQMRFSFSDDGDYRPQTYCGISNVLPADYDIYGTRNTCLKKGVGVGMGMSDSKRAEFMAKPRVVSQEKLYCGDKAILPAGYTGFGNLAMCLKRGVGVGLVMDPAKRREFQARPTSPLGKKELTDLARRLGVVNISGKTRREVEREVSQKINN